MTTPLSPEQRLQAASAIVADAASRALSLFRDRDTLAIEVKGLQDWVSNADKDVETLIRDRLAAEFPGDGILGEEHGRIASSTGYTWIIDPIDGTTCFVNGMPGWCVVLACVDSDGAVIGVIEDPINRDVFTAIRGQGTRCNGKPVQASRAGSLKAGSVSVGHSPRSPYKQTLRLLDALLGAGGMYVRTGSGANNLAYVASGRLIGYCEAHMNPWDCVAGLLMIEEAGGQIEPYELDAMLDGGGRVVAAGADVFPDLQRMANEAFAGA